MVADTPWVKCLIITKLNFGSTVQVGPPSENQAVTKQIVAAFSFALNTNLNGSAYYMLMHIGLKVRALRNELWCRVTNFCWPCKIQRGKLQNVL